MSNHAYDDGCENQDEDGAVVLTDAERYWHALRVLERACRAHATDATLAVAATQVTTTRTQLARRTAA